MPCQPIHVDTDRDLHSRPATLDYQYRAMQRVGLDVVCSSFQSNGTSLLRFQMASSLITKSITNKRVIRELICRFTFHMEGPNKKTNLILGKISNTERKTERVCLKRDHIDS